MKRLFLFLVFLITSLVSVSNFAWAQGSHQFSIKSKKAISLFRESRQTLKTSERITLLKKAIAKEPQFVEAYWDLSNVYLSIDSVDQAIAALEILNDKDLIYSDDTKRKLTFAYYCNGMYDEAVELCKQISDAYDTEIKRMLLSKYENAQFLRNHPVPFTPKNLNEVNTINDDYFPSITADGAMISTTVLVPAPSLYSEPIYQEDIYVSRLRSNKWTKAIPLTSLNTPGNEGSQSFSADGRYMFYVICNAQDGFGSCDIYYSIRRGNAWSEPMNLGEPANSIYWESNPVMSASADMIYFTSNRPGGLGDKDIWCVQVKILDNGMLRTYNARPLGAPINTEGAEFAPFIHADNQTLYFSSDGHDGLGGADIFMSKKLPNGGWANPLNVGYPINTHGNESGFVVNGAGDKAYFASDKIDANNRKLDIYEIDLPVGMQPSPMVFNAGKVTNAETHKPIQARVEIFNQVSNEKYFESISDKITGEFTVFLPANGVYGLSVEQPGFLFYTASIDKVGDSILVELQPIKSGSTTTLNNLFFGFDSDEILDSSTAEIERLYQFLKKNPKVNIEIVGHTDNQGSKSYNKNLSERRAAALMHALTNKGIQPSRISSRGMGSEHPIASNATEEGKAKNRRVEVIIK